MSQAPLGLRKLSIPPPGSFGSSIFIQFSQGGPVDPPERKVILLSWAILQGCYNSHPSESKDCIKMEEGLLELTQELQLQHFI